MWEVMKKVIAIGLDGLEPKIVESMLEAGDLPNLAKIRKQGGYRRLQTTYPAQTPVAWSTFATGTNPGGHGVFDFLRRDPQTYLPALSMNRYEQKNRFLPPQVANLRRGTPFWELLSNAGIPSTVLRCPVTYPPDKIKGRMLGGVGIPDLRGGLGTSTFYCEAEGVEQHESEKIVQVRRSGPVIETHLVGPRNPKTRDDLQFKITLHLEPSAKKVVLISDGQPKTLEIREGEWSDWLNVRFKAGMLQPSVSGNVRFFLVSMEPEFEFYASPINFDPSMPMFPISHPPEYAGELASKIGTFYTTGMVEDHDGLNNERISEDAYFAQCETVLRERERMMRYELNRFREGFFFCLFDTPDRIQHMFWRFREPDHPTNRAHGDYSPQMACVIEENYKACDAILGEALRRADDETLFMVLSDHGNNSFQRGVHLNTWLYENGWLALKNGATPGDDAGDFFKSVDWDKTKAYALGLGGIYLNIKGREGKGLLDPGEVEKARAGIIQGLTGLPDPERNRAAVRNVMAREQVYRGPFVDEAPDLVVNFEEGYRVSWETPLGGVPQGLFDDNTKKWAGDHMIDPCLAPGVLFMNRPIGGDSPSLMDMAPTILAALGVPQGPSMEGSALL
jgi:predicted AlkP superfamily phosphohydrolase/phosphomutase